MILKKFSLVIALLLSVCFVYAQPASTITVKVKNNTDYDYTCSVAFCQPDATPTTGNIVFNVPAMTSVTETYEFDDTDICLCGIKCYYSNLLPVGYFDVDCGAGYGDPPVNIAPVLNPGPPTTYYKFKYTGYTYTGATESHDFEIDDN